MTSKKINPHTYRRMLNKAVSDHKPSSKKKSDKPDRVNWILYGMLIALVLFSGFIYLKENTGIPPVYTYSNGDAEFEVRKITETESQIEFFMGEEPYVISVRHGPIELDDIEITQGIRNKIFDDELVYITFDPKEELTGEAALAAVEIGKVVANKYFFNIEIKNAVTSDYGNNTIMTCADANNLNTVIQIKKGKETKVLLEGDCVTIQGPTETEIVKAANRLSLHLVGIMP